MPDYIRSDLPIVQKNAPRLLYTVYTTVYRAQLTANNQYPVRFIMLRADVEDDIIIVSRFCLLLVLYYY